MWLAIKIGVFYGAPIVAVVLAIVCFAVLLIRVRRGSTGRARAAAFYPGALLLSPATVIVIWGTGELASYFAVGPGEFIWDGDAAIGFLVSLLPIAAYVAIPIALLVVAFWVTLAVSRPA